MAKKRKIVQEDLRTFAVQAVETEGFGYYMLTYGPDLDVIEHLGFNRKEVEKAIELFRKIEDKAQEIFDGIDNEA